MANILIVEDEEPINRLIKQNLALSGHVCDQLYDGKAAKERLESGASYNLIILVLLESYQAYYKNQNILLSLEKTEKKEAPAFRSKVSGGGKHAEIFAEQNLGEPYQAYRICYQKRLVDFEEVWRVLKRMFASVSLVMSVLLCLILYVFMRRMLKPLGSLNISL